MDLPIAGSTREALARLVHLEGHVNWTNEATAMGDLGLGVGTSDLRAVFDNSENMALGPQTEEGVLGVSDVREYGFQESSMLMAGPLTGSGFLAPFDLAYTFHVEADFNRAAADPSNCLYVMSGSQSNSKDDDPGGPGVAAPATAALALLVVLVGAAMVQRRRA